MKLKYLVIVIVFFCACGGDSTGPEEKVINMIIIPSAVDFGEIVIGEDKDVQVTITNGVESNDELSAELSISGANFSSQGANTSFNLQPGESEIVEVKFSANANGSFTGTLTIGHNATNQTSPNNVQLKGSVDNRSVEITRLIQSGWQLFEAQDFDGADVKFDSAVVLANFSPFYESMQAEAESGHGWTLAKKRNFSTAKNLFMNSLARASREASTDLNSNAGLAFVSHALNDYSLAIQHALQVLNDAPNYIFEHDIQVFHKSIRLVLAQSYYSAGDFTNAAAQLDILNPPGAPHSTEPDDLLKRIQDLWAII